MHLLIVLVVLIVIVCLVGWLIQSAPIPGPFAPLAKWALTAILVIVCIIYLLKFVPGL